MNSSDAEIWAPIAGYEGLYEVSSHGRVRSLDRLAYRGESVLRLKGAIKSCAIEGSGYRQAKLTKDGEGRLFRVNRLVAAAFVENPDGLAEVNHKDLDKLNNAAANLEWSSHAQNMDHAGKRGTQCGYMNPNKRLKLTPEDVDAIRAASARGETTRSIAPRFGISSRYVSAIARGKAWNPEIKITAPRLLAQDRAIAAQGAPQ